MGDAPTRREREQALNSRGRELALNLGAALGLLCVIAASLSMFFGITTLVFRSGSMAPTITTGALGLARPVAADKLEVGDIVSVIDPSDVRITHRVSGVEPVGDGSVSITTRGDANNTGDPAPYVVREVDRVFFHVNSLGYAVAWLSSPVATFLGGMAAGGLVVFAFWRRRDPELDQEDASVPEARAPVRGGIGHG